MPLLYSDPLHDHSGKISGAVNILLDITSRKKTEATAGRLAAIMDSFDETIVSKNLEGIVTGWSECASKLFGYTAGEIIGKPIVFLSPPQLYHDEAYILDRVRNGKSVSRYETVRQHKSGALVEVLLTVLPVKNVDGRVVGPSEIVRDISRRRQTELELNKAYAELLAEKCARESFVASLSHELRTPLSPILLVASNAAPNPEVPAAVRADFEMIRRNVQLETRLIDDLLDLTRVTHAKIVLKLPMSSACSLVNVREEANIASPVLNLDLASR